MSEQVGVQLVALDGPAVLATLNRFADVLTKTGTTAQRSSKEVDAAGNIMTGALQRVGQMATNALMNAGRAFVNFIQSSIKQAEDYESSMNVFQSVTGASADEMERAGQLAQELGADLDLPSTSAADAGKAMTELAKAGLSVNDVMTAAKGTLQLAAAGALSEAEAAEVAANALNTFGLEGEAATRVANYLSAAANSSSLEVKDAADSVKQAGSVFSSFQGPVVGAEQALIDTTVAISLLGNAGIKGSDAGTSLKQSLLMLAAPSDKARGIMEKLAGAVGETGSIAYTAEGKMRPFRDILDITAKSTANMTQQQRQYAISTIFGADATRSILSLLQAGPEKWDAMSASITAEGAASDLADARTKGLAGSIGGLQSQIETLAMEAILPLLPLLAGVVEKFSAWAGSWAGTLGPVMTAFVEGLIKAGEIIQAVFLPALYGATAATLAWAAANSGQLLIALALLFQRVMIATTAVTAHATAVALAALPYVAIAAAVGVVILKFQQFNAQVEDATAQMLAGKEFWTSSAKALEDFGQTSEETQQRYGGLAQSIRDQRELLEANVESLAKRQAAGLLTEETYNREMEALNRQATSIDAASKMLNTFVQEEVNAAKAHMTASDKLDAMTQDQGEFSGAVNISMDDLKKYEKQLEKTYEDGAKAVEDFTNTSVDFLTTITEQHKKNQDEQMLQTAKHYAEQAAAQKAHLGDMLADYTVTQKELGNITGEQAGVILEEIEKQYGGVQSTSARTFMEMTAQIDKFATEGGISVEELGQNLSGLTDASIETKQKMDALATKYTAELVQNFDEGKIDAEKLREELLKIPGKVYSEVHVTTYKHESGGSTAGNMASGGEYKPGKLTWVGERGPELFMSGSPGYMFNNREMADVARYLSGTHRREGASNIVMPPPQIIIMQPANTTTNNYQTQSAPQMPASRPAPGIWVPGVPVSDILNANIAERG